MKLRLTLSLCFLAAALVLASAANAAQCVQGLSNNAIENRSVVATTNLINSGDTITNILSQQIPEHRNVHVQEIENNRNYQFDGTVALLEQHGGMGMEFNAVEGRILALRENQAMGMQLDRQYTIANESVIEATDAAFMDHTAHDGFDTALASFKSGSVDHYVRFSSENNQGYRPTKVQGLLGFNSAGELTKILMIAGTVPPFGGFGGGDGPVFEVSKIRLIELR